MSKIVTAAEPANFKANAAGAAVSGRRRFLKGSAGVGAAYGLSTLAACSGGDTQSPVIESHFLNLKAIADAGDLYFVEGAQVSKVLPITKEALDAALEQKPYLSAVSSGITHYIEGVRKTPDLVAYGYITRIARGADPAGHGQIVRTLTLETAEDVAEGQAALRRGTAKKSLESSSTALARSSYSDIQDHAVTLVLQHPDLMTVDTDTIEALKIYITSASDFPAFVTYLQSAPDTWSVSEPLARADDTLVMLDDGTGKMVNPAVTSLSPQTLDFIVGIANEVLLLTHDDRTLAADIGDLQPGDPALEEFEGCLSFVRNGQTPRSLTPDFYDTNSGSTRRKSGNTSGTGWQLAAGSSAVGGGLEIRITSETSSNVKIRVTNRLARYMGVYATFYDGTGKAIRQYDDLDSLVSPQFFLLGIPVLESFLNVSIDIPDGCNRLDLVCAGAGKSTSNRVPDSVASNGALWTYGFIIVPPPLFLAAAAAVALNGYWATLKKLTAPMKKFITASKTIYYTFAAQTNPSSADVNKLAKHLTAEFVSIPELYIGLAAAITGGSLVNAIPFGSIATAIAAANAAGDFARGVEAITNHPRDTVTRFIYGNTVRVTPQFPSGNPAAGTRGYVYTLKTSGGWVQQITSTQADAIDFYGVPKDTGISASVAAYGGDDFGQAVGSREVLLAVGDYAGFNPPSNQVTTVNVPMTQLLRDLKPTSRYKKLAVTVGAESRDADGVPAVSWFAAGDALSFNGTTRLWGDIVAEPLMEVGNMTINSSTLFIGRTWATQEASVLSCVPGTSISAGTRYLFGNASSRYNNAAQDGGASTGYLVSGQAYADDTYGGERCGFSVLPLMAYDNFGFNSNRNYYLDPDSGYLLRRVDFFTYPTADGGVAIGAGDTARRPAYDPPSSRRSVGRFNALPSALLVHPSGKVVAVCAEASTIEVLTPLDAPTDDRDVPVATIVARVGYNVGNVSSPVGLASTAEGVLVVAENGNGRLQAFDIDGNPVKLFDGGTARTAPLYRWTAGMEVLDLCIENGGFIYVLSIDRSSASRATTLDIYRPDGSWLLRQADLDVKVLTVDVWRSMFTMNGGSTNQAGYRSYVPEPAITFWALG